MKLISAAFGSRVFAYSACRFGCCVTRSRREFLVSIDIDVLIAFAILQSVIVQDRFV
jgi:hypothetical protein